MHKETQTTEWWSWATRIKMGGRCWYTDWNISVKNHLKYLCEVFFKQVLNLKYPRECVWTVWKCQGILGDTNICFVIRPPGKAQHQGQKSHITAVKWVIIATTFGLGSGSSELFRVRSFKIIPVTRMSLIKPDSPFLKSWQRAFTSLQASF